MISGLFGSTIARANWVLGGLCAAWLLALLWISAPDNNLLKLLWSNNMAAWVQAFGTIAAIFGGAALSQRAWLKQRRTEHAERLRAAYIPIARACRFGLAVTDLGRSRSKKSDDRLRAEEVYRAQFRHDWNEGIVPSAIEDFLKRLDHVATGEPSGSMADLSIIISTRLCWIRDSVGRRLARGRPLPEADCEKSHRRIRTVLNKAHKLVNDAEKLAGMPLTRAMSLDLRYGIHE